MVTVEQVWEALAEVPDPEIPVISVVDLGVIRDVRVEDERVHVEFTPTFLGCPALEVMREQMAARIAELGVQPEVEVVLDDSWSTDRITDEGRREAPRGRLLAARIFARPRRRRSSSSSRTASAARTAARGTRAGEHLRPDAVPLAPLLPQLPPAVRAVQDDLSGGRPAFPAERPPRDAQRGTECGSARTWYSMIFRNDCAVAAAAAANGTSC